MSGADIQNCLKECFTRLPNLFFVEFLIYSHHSLFRLPGKRFPRWFWLKCPSSWCHSINGRGGPPWNCQQSRQRRFRLVLATCSTGVKESCLQPHSPLHTVGAQCLEFASLHTTSYTCFCWVFDLSHFCQKKCKYRKTSNCWKFLSQKNRPCWFSTLQKWHIVTYHTTHSCLTQPICCCLSGLSCSSAEPGERALNLCLL